MSSEDPTKAELVDENAELKRLLAERDAKIQQLAFQVGSLEDDLTRERLRADVAAEPVAEETQ